jgi:hypothetical protein
VFTGPRPAEEERFTSNPPEVRKEKPLPLAIISDNEVPSQLNLLSALLKYVGKIIL